MSRRLWPVLSVALVGGALTAGAFVFGGDGEFSLGQWRDESGDGVPGSALLTSHGDAHCETEDIWVLAVGRDADSDGLLFLRDPEGVIAATLGAGNPPEEPFDGDADLPLNAVDSRFRNGDVELWFEQDRSAALLIFDDRVERWPRTRFGLGCD